MNRPKWNARSARRGADLPGERLQLQDGCLDGWKGQILNLLGVALRDRGTQLGLHAATGTHRSTRKVGTLRREGRESQPNSAPQPGREQTGCLTGFRMLARKQVTAMSQSLRAVLSSEIQRVGAMPTHCSRQLLAQ